MIVRCPEGNPNDQQQLPRPQASARQYFKFFSRQMVELLSIGAGIAAFGVAIQSQKKLKEQNTVIYDLQDRLAALEIRGTGIQFDPKLMEQRITTTVDNRCCLVLQKDAKDTKKFIGETLAWKGITDSRLTNAESQTTKIEKINGTLTNLSILQQLNHNIAYGKQKKVEIMLSKNPSLALIPSDVIDCAGRHFKQITGFQYAIWSLDWYMWEMIKKYLPDEEIRRQITGLNNGAWVKEHGTQVSWQNLINALQTYLDKYNSWSSTECEKHWIQTVGLAQTALPAHVINEYHDHGGMIPFLRRTNLQRIGVETWFTAPWGGQLGEDFAWAGRGIVAAGSVGGRGALTARIGLGNPKHANSGGGGFTGVPRDAQENAVALRELLDTRKKQAQELISEFSLNIKQKLRV